MEIKFRFELNATVTTVALLEETIARDAVGDKPWFCFGQIIERRSSECSAGVQYSYMVSFNGHNAIYHEDQLRPSREMYDLWLSRLGVAASTTIVHDGKTDGASDATR